MAGDAAAGTEGCQSENGRILINTRLREFCVHQFRVVMHSGASVATDVPASA